MGTVATEFTFNGSTVPYASYDSTKTTLGNLIVQNSGPTNFTNYAGPMPVTMTRFFEINGSNACFPYVIDVGNGVHWVFLASNASASTQRGIYLYIFNVNTQILDYIGIITIQPGSGTNHTIVGFAVVRHFYTTGTVSVSSSAVTGSGTAWKTAGYAHSGARIGFGDTNPNNITNWYVYGAMANDTSITLDYPSAATLTNVSFVIDELRIYIATTASTTTNGGLFVTKGVCIQQFYGSTVGINLYGSGGSNDNLAATYWLMDAATETNTVACGLVVSSTYSDTSHIMYVINKDAASTLRIYKYDGRVALTGLSLTTGGSTSAFILKTGQQVVTGTIYGFCSTCLATLNHGPGQGVSCLYIPTTTRVYRVPETYIVDSSTSYVADGLLEIPTGSVNTFAATANLATVRYLSTIDRLAITNATGSVRQYITRYQSNALQIDKTFGQSTLQLDESLADPGLTPYPTTAATFFLFDMNGYTYIYKNSNTAASGQMYVVPLGADWDFAYSTNCRLISPALSTPNCFKYSKLYVRNNKIGNSFQANNALPTTSNSFGLQPEPFRIYYRTKGITNNSGTWILLDDSGDLSAAPPSSSIQFMFEFRIIGNFCVPAKIYGLMVTYLDASTDSHFQLSTQLSNTKTKTFAWRFATAFGTTTPSLSVYLYDALTGNLLLNDNTVSAAYGTFYKSTNGGSTWASYNTTDLGNTTTYIKYVPTILGNNMTIRALLILTPT